MVPTFVPTLGSSRSSQGSGDSEENGGPLVPLFGLGLFAVLVFWGINLAVSGLPCRSAIHWEATGNVLKEMSCYCGDSPRVVGDVYQASGKVWSAYAYRSRGCSEHFRTEDAAKECVEKAVKSWWPF